MGKAPQNIDTAPMLHLIIAGVIGVVLFFVGIILSFAGPDPDIITSTTLYQCPGSQHKWEKDKCKGPQNLTSYTVEFLHLRVAGGYWGLVMQPYRKVAEPAPKKDSMVKMTLNAEVVAYNTDSKGIWTNKKVTNETYTFKCHTKSNEGRCEPLIVKHSNKIRHSGLKFTFTFNDASEVGDVIFRQERGNPKRASLVLSFDVIYILLAFFLFLAFGYFMKDFPLSEWTLNQKFVVFLAFGFILYNAPFLSLDYALRSTFLVFIGTLFRILFIGLLFFYWMLYAYSLRSNDPFTFKNKLHIIQISMVAVYIVLSAIGFGWLNVSDHLDPVMSQAESIPGVIAFVVLSDIALVAVFVWIGIAIVVGARDAFSSKEAMTNFIFTITPIIVVVISMFFGIFFNNYGIVNHKKSDLFFSTLYFTYLLLVAFSAFPGVLFSCSTARSASASSFSSSDDPERNEFVKGPDKVVDNADDDDDDENVKQRLI